MYRGRDGWVEVYMLPINMKMEPNSPLHMGRLFLSVFVKHFKVCLPTSDPGRTSDPLVPVWLGLSGPFAKDKDGNI